MKKIKAFFIDGKENKEIVINADLEEYYALINCHTIDIGVRKIGNKCFDIICDDNAFLYENFKVSAINKNREIMLADNLIIVGVADDNGCETSLSDDDVALIKQNINHLGMLVCEYE
ncbi:DUF3846 domain-containing protein [Campylobacter sp. JMF_03 NE3]|uniref:DUF3846 domain-containing protein n=1 Tax=Campylobacter sp. JMF_03 NE3 TaxID=2983831 RepID=UPI0022E9DB13|nr:hypothetical protein [Campylobacter sp. JMF_03 NE3]MDA3053578.1 hypothetical protein [Campylobacter sp. JMF_03 NE3]